MVSFPRYGEGGFGRKIVVVCALLLVLLAIIACSSEKTSDTLDEKKAQAEGVGNKSDNAKIQAKAGKNPEEIVHMYMQASRQGEMKAVLRSMTDEARKAFSSWEQTAQEQGQKGEKFVVGEATVENDLARVPVTTTGPVKSQPHRELTFLLRSSDGRWGIYALETVLENGSKFTLNFEKMDSVAKKMEGAFRQMVSPDSETMRRDAEVQQKSYDALQKISPERFETAWKRDLAAQNRPASEVLAELLAPMGVLPPSDTGDGLIDAPVSVSLKGKSRLEAIEAVCAQIGHYPEYPYTPEMRYGVMGGFVETFAQSFGEMAEEGDDAHASNALRLIKGARPRPAFFFGPLMMVVREIKQHSAYATGHLSLTVFGADIDHGVFELLGETDDPFHVETLEDRNGNSLLHSITHGMRFSPYGEGAFFRLDRTVHLKSLLRHIAEIREFSGKMVFHLPEAMLQGEFRFENDGEKRTESLGPLSVVSWRKAKEIFLEFAGPSSVLGNRLVKYAPADARGEPVFVSTTGHNWAIIEGSDEPGEVSAQISLSRPAASVACKYVSRVENVEFSFSVKSLALPSPELMPEALPPLEHPNFDEPVSLEFVELDRSDPYFGKARVRIVNHSNKDISRIEAKFVYLDDGENEINEFPHQLEGAETPEGRELYVAAGQTAEKRVPAFFIPLNMVGVEFRIDRVEFMDASLWEH